jgi:CitMHS family citrate-Mg2+:H+ or citrate-Ca2+:H+ symporter
MLAALGFATIAIFLFAIMTKRVSVLVALILIPTAAGLVAGAGAGLGKMMLEGINRVAPVGVMIIFAVLYFGLMLDVGLFEPMIRRLLRFVKGDPLKVALVLPCSPWPSHSMETVPPRSLSQFLPCYRSTSGLA